MIEPTVLTPGVKSQAETDVAAWNLAMSKAFKGIVSRPQRRQLLQRALDRIQKEADAR